MTNVGAKSQTGDDRLIQDTSDNTVTLAVNSQSDGEAKMTALRGFKSNNKISDFGNILQQRNLKLNGEGKSNQVSKESRPSPSGMLHQQVGSEKGGPSTTMPTATESSQPVLSGTNASIPPSSPLLNSVNVTDPEFDLDEWQGETIPGHFTDGTSQFINDTDAMETPIEPLSGTGITTASISSNSTSISSTPSAAAETSVLPTTSVSPSNNMTTPGHSGQIHGNNHATTRPIATKSPRDSSFNMDKTRTEYPTSAPTGFAGLPPDDTFHDGQHPTGDDDSIMNIPTVHPESPISTIGGGGNTGSPTNPSSACGKPLFSNDVLTCHRRLHPFPFYSSLVSIVLVFVCLSRYICCRRIGKGRSHDPRGEYRSVASQFGRNGFDNAFSDELSNESDDGGYMDDMEDDSWGNSGQKVLELGSFRSTEQNGGLTLAEMNG